MIALSQPTTITVTVAGALIVLGVLVLLRLILRREPTPPRWRRYRLGVFVERDPSDEGVENVGDEK